MKIYHVAIETVVTEVVELVLSKDSTVDDAIKMALDGQECRLLSSHESEAKVKQIWEKPTGLAAEPDAVFLSIPQDILSTS
jgi:hypothetical protein